MSAAARPWWEDELAGCVFADARLGERLRRIVGRMDGALGASLPFACQDWAGTKGSACRPAASTSATVKATSTSCTAWPRIWAHFIVRSCVDRLAGDGGHTLADEMDEVAVSGLHRVEVRDGKGRLGTALVELRYRRIRVLPPIGKQKRCPALALTVLQAREREAPPDRPAIGWKLITDLPVTSEAEALEKLRWYALRWKIEVFHKILKTGCRAEKARLRTAERLVKLIAVFCILSWRVFWITRVGRCAPKADPRLAITPEEMVLLDRLVPDRRPSDGTLSAYLLKLARLGGYLARARNPPPSNLVMWRGLTRLTDIALGATARPCRHAMRVIGSRALGAANAPAVVWVRIGNSTKRVLLERFSTALPAIVDALEHGETIVQLSD